MKPYYEDTKSGIVIYHGDCREILPTLGKFDLLLTDPPYGIGVAKSGTIGSLPKPGHKRNGVGTPNTIFSPVKWDSEPISKETIALIRKSSENQIIFGGNYFHLPPSQGWIIWDKVNDGTDFADCEMAWTSFDVASRIKRFMWNGMLQGDMRNKEYRQHPTQKPVPVMTYAIYFAERAGGVKIQTILDPFAGSGTTGRAAKDLGKSCTMIEQEEKYCEIIALRMSQEVLPLT